MKKIKTRVLLGSPVHQKPSILRQFLDSLHRLKLDNLELDYYLIDDNEDEQSSLLLEEFKGTRENVFLQTSGYRDPYIRDDTTYLFLIDSDLLLHPLTLEHLAASGKDIISEVFWTQWQPNTILQPQVWMHDEYSQWERLPGEQLSAEEISYRFNHFLSKLQIPGVYEVGGLGACTLISRHAIESGVSYNIIKNISYWGEDRHFCIRAAALGIPLYVDTHYPALHLYRDSDLSKVDDFILSNTSEPLPIPQPRKRPKLTLTMIVKNESPRFLRQVLEAHREYIDEAVIIDDGSTDDTAALCIELLKGIPVHMVHNEISKFSNEIELRKQQWEEVIKRDPEWILNLDGDEIFEERFAHEIDTLLQEDNVELFCFRLYDFWNKDHYREDAYWRSHLSYRPFLLKYNKDFTYVWNELPQHCGRFPENIFELPHQLSNLRLKHLGWSKPEYRMEKYLRYMHLDPDGQYGWKEQYLSILDQQPKLIPWVE
jgi:hypothetical protein